MPGIQPLRVFLSSPGDLFPERDVIKKVIDELNRSPHYQERFKIIAYAYEDRAPAAVGEGAQIAVDRYTIRPDAADIFVCMMWLRMGTETKSLINPDTGKPYQSGTEYEFLTAYRARVKNGKPLILLYRCEREPDQGFAKFMANSAERAQYDAVNTFFTRFNPDGDLNGLYIKFTTPESLEHRIRHDLEMMLSDPDQFVDLPVPIPKAPEQPPPEPKPADKPPSEPVSPAQEWIASFMSQPAKPNVASSATPSVPIPTLNTLNVQPTDLVPFAMYFPELSMFNFQPYGSADAMQYGQAWQTLGCFNLVRTLPGTLQRLNWRGCGAISFTAPVNPCWSPGFLHSLVFELHEFSTAQGPAGWTTDQALLTAYRTDGVFQQIQPNAVFPGAVFGTGMQYNLCPGIALVNGELWAGFGRFLVVARVVCKPGTNNPAVWNLKTTAIQAVQGRLRMAGLLA